MFDAVSIAKCDSYDELIVNKAMDEVLSSIAGLDFIKPGMKVGIKANLVSGMDPDKAATTHPSVLKALCTKIKEKGAKVCVGDSPGGIYTPAHVHSVYKACGLYELVDDAVELNENFGVSDAEFKEAVSLKTFEYTSWLDDVDVIINFSKLKTHAMMGMSCAVKNMFGTVPGTTKPQYHMRFNDEMAFANVMVDLNEYFKPVLYVVDAIDGMEGNGPTAGEKRHIGSLLASKKPYALDLVCADIIGMKMSDVATIRAAYERGLGPSDISEVTIVSGDVLESFRIPDFKRATFHQSINFEGGDFGETLKAFFTKTFYTAKPLVKKDECIGCRKCHDICPAKAITMVKEKKNDIPKVDRSKCIKCFCCQEFCPKGAMKVKDNPLGKMLNKMQRRNV